MFLEGLVVIRPFYFLRYLLNNYKPYPCCSLGLFSIKLVIILYYTIVNRQTDFTRMHIWLTVDPVLA